MEAGKRAEDELSTEECRGLIDEMKALGTEMLILTGGEPLLRRDIYDIANYASDHGIWVVMGTNGVLVTDKVVKKMLECGVRGVGISIDSLDPDKHNSFRGGPNSWAYSVRALEICKEQGLDVLVQSTVMENNYDEIPRLIDFAQEKGAWSFNLYFLVRTGRGHEMNDLSPEKTEAMLADLVEVQDRYRPMLVRSKCAPHFKRIAYEKGVGGLESGGCMAGTQYGRITPDGDVTPCPYMTIVAGNVREKGLTGIWKTSPVLEELRYLDRLKGRCGICEFKELCGGCRCRAYAAFGDYLQEDPACTYQPTGHELDFGKITWSPEASARLKRIPIRFVREKVEKGVETYAQRKDVRLITPDLMKEAIAGMERPTVFGKMPDFRKHEDQEKKKAKN
jgi:radical SAM protein with 4Fe4S-binding SPASM domain